MNKVTEHEPNSTSLIGSIHTTPNYQDRFSIDADHMQYTDIDQVASDWFLKQPGWIRVISTNTLSKKSIAAAIKTGEYAVGISIGSWKIYKRNDQEIVFGDSMGFMEYRFSLSLRNEERTVEGATSVQYLWPRAGKFYFALVRPMHRRFVAYLLKKTVS